MYFDMSVMRGSRSGSTPQIRAPSDILGLETRPVRCRRRPHASTRGSESMILAAGSGSAMYLSGNLGSSTSERWMRTWPVKEPVAFSTSWFCRDLIMLWPNMIAARPKPMAATLIRLRRPLRHTLRQARRSTLGASLLQALVAEEVVGERQVELELVVDERRALARLVGRHADELGRHAAAAQDLHVGEGDGADQLAALGVVFL